MNLTVINFANSTFKTQQNWNSKSAKLIGGADQVISYSPKDIENYFDQYPLFKKYSTKGFGNYFWKPFIIQKAMMEVDDNEYLFYADSGSVFLKNIKNLCKELEKSKKEIMVFQLPLIEKQWTKRDAFILLGADLKEITDSPQRLGGFILFKKTKATLQFIENYRLACLDERIISDLDNTLNKSNYPEFVEHRHDQSILSILSKKSEIVQVEKDLSDYGLFPKAYASEGRLLDKSSLDKKNIKFKGYLISNRKVHPLKYLIKYFIKRLFLR